jgi:hypothetical protein
LEEPKNKPRLIRQLHPDLIIANKEENLQAEVEELAKEFPVWIVISKASKVPMT